MKRQELEAILEQHLKPIGEVIQSKPWSDKEFYANWCAQTYKYVCHSAPLIQKTAEGLPPGHLKSEMEKHYREEVGHEKFALRDAAHFGVDAEAAPEMEATKNMYSYASRTIDNDPAAMYGYAFCLEHISKYYAPWMAEQAANHFGVETSRIHTKNVPVSFLTLHAEVDQDHADCGLEALDHIPEESHSLVVEVMLETFENYKNFLNAIEEQSSKANKAA